MEFAVEHDDTNFGVLVIALGPDDSAEVMLDGEGSSLRIPMFAHEASDLRGMLLPLADLEEQDAGTPGEELADVPRTQAAGDEQVPRGQDDEQPHEAATA